MMATRCRKQISETVLHCVNWNCLQHIDIDLMDLDTFSLKQVGKRRTATRVVGILMKSLQVTQEQLHVLEQFLAADLPAATPGECCMAKNFVTSRCCNC